MTRESARLSDLVSRRKFVAAAGSAGAAAVAGCSESGGSGDGDSADGGSGSEASSGDGSTATDSDGSESSGGGGMDTSVLTGDGSSTVFPITNTAASYWNSNPEAGDGDYWPSEWAEEYGTDMRLADYFASEYGYEATGERSSPPYRVSIALSHSGTGIEGVMEGRVDIGDASSSAASELGEDAEGLDGFVDHVVGVDGQPIVVSPEIADAGVEQITIDDLRGMYKGEITNWSASPAVAKVVAAHPVTATSPVRAMLVPLPRPLFVREPNSWAASIASSASSAAS